MTWFSTNFLQITVILSLSLHYVRKNAELNSYLRMWHSQLSLSIYNVIKYIALPLLGLIQQKIILAMHSYSHTELSLARFPCSPYCSSAGRLLIGQKMRHFDSASRRNFPVVEQTIGCAIPGAGQARYIKEKSKCTEIEWISMKGIYTIHLERISVSITQTFKI